MRLGLAATQIALVLDVQELVLRELVETVVQRRVVAQVVDLQGQVHQRIDGFGDAPA